MKQLVLAFLILNADTLSAQGDFVKSDPWYLKPWHFLQHKLHIRRVSADFRTIEHSMLRSREIDGRFPSELSSDLPQTDPWGSPYQLRLSLLGTEGTAHVTSAGKDRVFGNSDDLGIIIR